MAGNPASRANLVIRTTFAITKASPTTYKTSARPFAPSKAGAMSSARRISKTADSNPSPRRRCLNLRQFFSGRGIPDVDKYCQSAATWGELAQEFEALSGQIRALRREAGDIAAWSRKAINKPAANGVDGQGEDDRNSRCRLPCSRDSVAPGHNDIDVGINKLCRNLGEAFGASLCPAAFDDDVLAFDPAQFAQSLYEGIGP